MGSLATGAGLFVRLLGPEVTGVMARLDGPDPENVRPEEAALVAGAVHRRRHEFLVGRACAHAALAAVGRDIDTIAVGSRREPLWPPGIVGSIAHGGDWVGAVTAPADHARGLGLDIEPLDPPLSQGVTERVLTPAEQAGVPRDESRAGRWAKVAFTAKECVYKALYPSTGWLLGYADVEIDLDLTAGRWQATLEERFDLDGRTLQGRFEVADHHIVTAVLCAISNTHG